MLYGLLRLLAFAIFALITFGLVAQTISAIRTGTVAVRNTKPFRRRKEPVAFWGAVTAYALMAVGAVAALVYAASR